MLGNGAAGASYGDLLMTSLLVLGAVCIAAFVVVRLVGRFAMPGRARGAHLLDVVARVPLEPRRSLYVIEVAGKTLLVGTSEMGLSVLSELDAAEVRARVDERPSFGDLVRTAWLRRRAPATAPRDDAETPSVRGEAALASVRSEVAMPARGGAVSPARGGAVSPARGDGASRSDEESVVSLSGIRGGSTAAATHQDGDLAGAADRAVSAVTSDAVVLECAASDERPDVRASSEAR